MRTMVSSSCVPSGRMEGCLCRGEEELSLPAANMNPHDVAEGRQAAIGSSEGWLVAVILLDVFPTSFEPPHNSIVRGRLDGWWWWDFCGSSSLGTAVSWELFRMTCNPPVLHGGGRELLGTPCRRLVVKPRGQVSGQGQLFCK